jgi:hypothetical protein
VLRQAPDLVDRVIADPKNRGPLNCPASPLLCATRHKAGWPCVPRRRPASDDLPVTAAAILRDAALMSAAFTASATPALNSGASVIGEASTASPGRSGGATGADCPAGSRDGRERFHAWQQRARCQRAIPKVAHAQGT